MAERLAIIGAGMAGATAARTLKDAGQEITLFEKSGGSGGRLATRRSDYGNFDHGAQYVTAKSDAFRAMMTGLSRAGNVGFWEPGEKTNDKKWHVGLPGMSGLIKPILGDIDIRKKTLITKLTADDDGVHVTDDDGNTSTFDRVIVAIPSPQAYALLAPVDSIFSSLNSVIYMPCWTTMFAFDVPVQNLPDLYRGEDTETISWLARNSSKPDRGNEQTFVAQAGAVWSHEHLEQSKDVIAERMKTRLDEMAGQALSPVFVAAHRWRYARVDKPLGTAFLEGCNERCFAIGDGMLGGRVEAAFESARQLCNHLKSNVLDSN